MTMPFAEVTLTPSNSFCVVVKKTVRGGEDPFPVLTLMPDDDLTLREIKEKFKQVMSPEQANVLASQALKEMRRLKP